MFKKIIDSFYKPVEYPALLDQMERWSKTRPLQGLRVLDASPIFRNSLVKYNALLAAGASLSIGFSEKVPHDESIVQMIHEFGLPVYSPDKYIENWDIVLDCAAQFAFLQPKYGFVELTRSGVSIYEKSEKPVYVADSSEIKKIETSLGTGESYFRAFREFGKTDWNHRKLLVFGSGKVGMGIIQHGLTLGADISVVTDISMNGEELLKMGVSSVTDFRNREEVASKIKEAEFVVTATGIKNALDHSELVSAFFETKAILANMGVEDEYGPNVLDTKVLYMKKPLNFILEEPTHLKYIDASLALHNALGIALLNTSGKGICEIPKELEDQILSITKKNGVIL